MKTLRLSVLDPSPVADGSSPAETLERSIDLARHVDQLGYSRFWMNEHHGLKSLISIAPEVVLARVGVETRRIRIGTGGILLPHYAPLKVAEVFRTLQALYPHRVDLGIARPAGSAVPVAALRREHEVEPRDDFPEQLRELLSFLGKREFPAGHAFSNVPVVPESNDDAPVWLLGSSMHSAKVAAELGLPYAYSHFHNPGGSREVFEAYRRSFRPQISGDSPTGVAFVGVMCASTQAEAERLHSSFQYFFQGLRARKPVALLNPDVALARLEEPVETPAEEETEWPRILVGTPRLVKEQLLAMATAFCVNEIVVQTVCWDHQSRLDSYTLLAEALTLAA